jgi:RNA polymerase sigma-70 factor (ECF subfamily)
LREKPEHNIERQTNERFTQLIAPLLARLSRYAFALTNNVDDAKDLLSEASLKAFEQADRLRSTEAFCSYMFIVIRRIHVRQLRRKRLLNLFKEQIEASTHDPRSSIDLQLDVTLLYNALNLLPVKQRETVMLFEISELSIEEIRNIQGGSISGVKSRLTRGRERLTELLSDTLQTIERKKLAPETTLASQKA